jgi:dihydroflavonol-4-reductase
VNIAVTGPTGHVGPCLIPELLEHGHRVRAVVYGDASVLDGLDVEKVPGDVRDLDSMRAAFAGQDIVIHLAAHISVQAKDEPLMQAVNVGGVKNAATAALEAGVKRFVHVSSVHAYDTWRLDEPLTETHAKADRPGLPPYDRSKAAGERALRGVIAEGLDAVILNPVGILGPKDHRPSLMGTVLKEMVRGRMPIVPDGGFCWVDVRDVVQAIIAAIEVAETGENYLLSSEKVSTIEFHRMSRRAMGRRSRAVRAPMPLLRAVSRVAPVLAPVSPVMNGFTADSLHALDARLTVDVRKARRALGFNPRPMAHTVTATIEWWRANAFLS